MPSFNTFIPPICHAGRALLASHLRYVNVWVQPCVGGQEETEMADMISTRQKFI
jgi:hypothetical protein